nr:MAG TPA: hypothetical protein [Caudoviricetes sp.]
MKINPPRKRWVFFCPHGPTSAWCGWIAQKAN